MEILYVEQSDHKSRMNFSTMDLYVLVEEVNTGSRGGLDADER